MAWPHDGPSWSPDNGEYWCKDRVVYWWNGAVTITHPGTFIAIRSMDSGNKTREDFSAWSDEKRAAELEKFNSAEKIRVAKLEEERRKVAESRQSLVDSAKSKLTEEELKALREYFWDNE